MDQLKLDGKTPKRAWFVRVGPFGGMMPWSLLGWLWFFFVLAVAGSIGAYANQLSLTDPSQAQYWWVALSCVIILGLIVALKKSTRR